MKLRETFNLQVPDPAVCFRSLLAASMLLLAACGTRSDLRADAGIDHSGRMRGYVESRRVTDFCPDQARRPADARCVVTRGWDYDRGKMIVRVFNPAGSVIHTDESQLSESSLTTAEQARVEALVRADPRTRDLVNKPGVTFWAGGFVMREPGDRWCDTGSRCIRAIAVVDDGNTAILHSVVDLMRDEVVYPDYLPSGKKVVQRDEEH